MQNSWQSLLTDHGAVIEDNVVVHFGDKNAERTHVRADTVLCDLSHLGLIAVSGTDASNFLQGQFSNDIRHVDVHQGQLSAWCTPKGRVICTLEIFCRADELYLQLAADLESRVLARLRMFVLRADVALRQPGDELVRFGIAGPNAEKILESCGLTSPTGAYGVEHTDDVTVLRIPGDEPRFEVVSPPEKASGLWQTAARHATPVGADAWRLLELLAGRPEIEADNSDAYIPHMLNLPALGAVSFTKGCYAGQEIVARTEHLGKLKRRMYLARSDSAPSSGDAIFGHDNTKVGTVLNVLPMDDHAFALLAILQIDAARTGQLCLGAPAGPPLNLDPLPYPTDSTTSVGPTSAGVQ